MSGGPTRSGSERAEGEARPARLLLALGALSGGVAVALGAFGAHALDGAVPPERLATWRTGASYHLLHALATVIAAGLAPTLGKRAQTAAVLFLVGTALFSVSLYTLVLLDAPVMGAVAPLGGGAFIGGWLVLALAAWRSTQ